MIGVTVVDKPKGMTSHDVVNVIRREFKLRRVGHTGTLDPIASGVLPICIGAATKAAGLISDGDKRYTTRFCLGIETDTLDSEGTVVRRREVNVTEEEVAEAVSHYIGEQMQLPPMYSAIKKNGVRLYELARKGIETEREKRRINIYAADVLETALPYVTIDVKCSKGTYIRSLCADIGERLGCGAVMTELRRTETAGFTLDDAVSLDEIKAAEDKESLIIPLDTVFRDLPEIRLNERQQHSIVNGVRMTWRGGEEGQSYRLYGADGKLLCISRLHDTKLILERSFWND